MKKKRLTLKRNTLSWIIVLVLAVLSLAIGWLLKDSIQNQAQIFNRQGLAFQIPAGWAIQDGIVGDEMIFSAYPPLERNHRFIASVLPATADSKPSDLVTIRTIGFGERLLLFQVLDRTSMVVYGKDAYKMTYAYAKMDDPAKLAQQILGIETYFRIGEKFIILSMENERAQFDSALTGYSSFISSFVSILGK